MVAAAVIGAEEVLPIVATAAPVLLDVLKDLPKKIGVKADEILPKIEENLEKFKLNCWSCVRFTQQYKGCG